MDAAEPFDLDGTLETLDRLGLGEDFLESMEQTAVEASMPSQPDQRDSSERPLVVSRRQELAAESRQDMVAARPANTSKSCTWGKRAFENWCSATGRSTVLTNETSEEYARWCIVYSVIYRFF